MEGFYALRGELRDKFHNLVKTSASEETFIEFISNSLQKSNKLGTKALEVILDLTLAVVDHTGDLDCNSYHRAHHSSTVIEQQHEDEDTATTTNTASEPPIAISFPENTSYDADDEGFDATFIFPCHLIFDDCHPELLFDYHRDHLKASKTYAQIIKYPKLCEFVIDFIFRNLKFQYEQLGKIPSTLNKDQKLIARHQVLEGIDDEDDFDDNQSRRSVQIASIVSSENQANLFKYIESIVVMIRKLNKICTAEKKNCRILSRTNMIEIVLSNILYLLDTIPEKQHLYLEALLKFVFTLVDYKITGESLRKLFTIIKNENADLSVILSSFEHLLSHHYRILKNIQPLKSINFPTASRTSEEIESDPYISNSWHWRLRNKVIDSKRKRSRTISTDSQQQVRSEVLSRIANNQAVDEKASLDTREATLTKLVTPVVDRITPSWLECSIMAPLSNISPLVQNGEVRLCCSMWLSVCGDLLVIDECRSKRATEDMISAQRSDWRLGHWLRLTSRKRLARRYKEKKLNNQRRSRSRRLSAKFLKKQAQDREDEEKEELDQQIKRSELELNQASQQITYGKLKFNTNLPSMATADRQARDTPNKKPDMASNEAAKNKRPPKEFLGRRARENSQELLMHLVSFAFDALTIEIWLNVKCMVFCARACRIAREGQTILIDQVTFPSHLDANGSWSHIMFSLEEVSKQSEKVMNLKVIVNGIYKEKEKLVYGNHKSPLTNFACLIGCERSTFGYVWKLSQLNIYKNIPPKDLPMCLLGKGPDFWSFTNFRQNSTLPLPDITQRSIKNLLNPKLLNSYRTIDEERSLNWITQNIVIAYVAHQSDYFLDYSPSMTTSSLMNPLPADHEFSNSAERFIQAKILNFSRTLKFNTNNGFGSALVEAGGIESVLICFADVIRRAQEDSITHALAFSILLKMSQTNQHHLNKFLDELNGLKLIEFILTHPDCTVSKLMLDYYFEFCLMKRNEYSLIKSSKLLYHLMSCWRAWHKDVRVAKSLYRKLIRLLQPSGTLRRLQPEEHKLESYYISHNFIMMTQAGGIDILMSILRECLVPLDDYVPKINQELVELIVNLISLLIKHPPGLDVMLDIMEFLLFLHPDPKAYVPSKDKTFFLRVLKSKTRDTEHSTGYDGTTSRVRTPLSETSSYRSSMDNHLNNNYNHSSGSNVEGTKGFDYSRATSLSNDDFSSENSHRNDTSEECSKNLATFMDRFSVRHDRRHGDEFSWTDEAEFGAQNIKRNQTKTSNTHETGQKCSNRNYAIASIADMLASIVKLTLTDPMKILSEALQKSIIDARKLIILANNDSSLVREKVLRLFFYCIRACYTLNLKSVLGKYERDTKGSSFKSCIPIQLMARQLLKYPTTIKMIQLCYGIIVGIDDFETVESVCLVFDIETLNNNLQLNTLLLLIQLMTKLQEPKEIVSAVGFVHAYIKQLLQLGEDAILAVLVKNNLIDSLMRIYFTYVEHRVGIDENTDRHDACGDDNFKDKFDEVREELDKTLILIVRYFIQNLITSETIKSIEDLLIYFDLVNSYVPTKFQSILRDRQVKVLCMAMIYCENYEDYARQKSFGGKFDYYVKSLFKNNDFNTFPNALSDSQLDLNQATFFDGPDHTQFSAYRYGDEKVEMDSSLIKAIQSKRVNGRSETNGHGLDNSNGANQDANSIGDEQMISLSEGKTLNENNVIERFEATIRFAINFITTRDPDVIPSPLERKFTIKCVKTLSRHLNDHHLITSGQIKDISHWLIMLPKLVEPIRARFTRLILFLLSPCDSMNLDERKYQASQILNLFSVEQLLRLLDHTSKETTYKVLIVFIRDLIECNNSSINSEDEESEQDDLISNDDDIEVKLRQLAERIEQELNGPTIGTNKLNGYLDMIGKRTKVNLGRVQLLDTKFCDIWMAQGDLAQAREEARDRLEALREISSVISSDNPDDESFGILKDEADKITRDVVNDKHEQRKVYLEDLKQSKVCNYHIRQQWLSLIIGHTHERAIWFMPSKYPSSWELNPVEGPSRIRRRLRPCKLMLEGKFLRQPTNTGQPSPLCSMRVSQNYQHNSTFDGIERTKNTEVVADDWYNLYSPHPLCSMVIYQEQSMDPNELRHRMFTTDKIHFHCDCSIIRPNEVCEGEVSIASWCIHFIGERSDNYQRHLNDNMALKRAKSGQARSGGTGVDDSGYEGRVNSTATTSERFITTTTGAISKKNKIFARMPGYNSTIVEDLWFDEIVEIWDRRYQLQDLGLEIFLTNNMTYLISFRNNSDREDFKQSLMREQHKMINLQRINLSTSLNRVTQLWRDGRLTNFDYLTCLNKLAGRSFNDLMQYPIFPFILSNYTTNVLDLNLPNNFRKLKKPMAIQNPEKEANFVNNYQMSQTTSLSVGPCGMTKPYHYGNHYSNSATVLHFLVRLPPFTQMLIQYQDNNFDQPDRTFHSIANTWQLITRDSNTDFKELIPEFFFLPEMFINFEQFELGRKQNSELVDDVRLPSWCPNSDARLFTLIHRQALESAYVSENLHHWIDLVFGFKQTGKPAVEAINVFHPATYYGMIDLNCQTGSSTNSPTPINSNTSISAKSSTYGSAFMSNTDMSTTHHCSSNTGNGGTNTVSDAESLKRSAYLYKLQQADIERLALETMIKTYGQMPRQLFAQPMRQRSFVTYAPQTSVNQSTNSEPLPKKLEPLEQVKGLKWGSYVGSPDENDITAVKHKRIVPETQTSSKQRRAALRGHPVPRENVRFNLCLLPNGEIALLRDNHSLMLDYRADRKSGGGYQFSMPATPRSSRRAGLSKVARINLFSNMIISRQQFGYVESSSFSVGQFSDSAGSNSTSSSSLKLLTSSKAKFSHDSLSLVSWSYLDGIIRIKHPAMNNQKPNVPLVQADSIVDSMSTCATVPELNLLLVGYKSGSICAHIVSTCHETVPIALYEQSPQSSSNSSLATTPTLAQSSSSAAPSAVHFLHTTTSPSSSLSDTLAPLGPGKVANNSPTGEPYTAVSLAGKTLQSVRSINKSTRWLYCHSKKVNCMRINVSFGIVVTGSDDGTCVIWDLNSLTYVRTIDYKLNSLRVKNRDQKRDSKTPERGPIDPRLPNNLWKMNNQRLLDYLCSCGQPSSRTASPINGGNQNNCMSNTKQACICGSGVSLIAISDTLGDIVSVKDISNRLALATDCDDSDNVSRGTNVSTTSLGSSSQSDSSLSSILYVHTINGALVGFVNCNTQVTAICYSNAPEGVSVNVIVVGLADGLIRLYSSWDLSRVKEFYVSGLGQPITSLLYSRDNQLLYTVYEDGQLLVLRNKKKTSIALPKEWFL